MSFKDSWKSLLLMLVVFAAAFYMPLSSERFQSGVTESLHLLQEYAREHVILCLLPALFIAGGLAVFLKKEAVMKYLGPRAKKVVAYGVASVSGSILAVCSCTVLPLFAGIYKMGAGLGPASAFLYAGPAINVLAIILSARVLGIEIGVARAVGAVVFSVVIGLLMHLIYRREEQERSAGFQFTEGDDSQPLVQRVIIFASLVGLLIFANWGSPETATGLWHGVWSMKWVISTVFAVLIGTASVLWLGVKAWKIVLVAAVAAGASLLDAGALAAFGLGVAAFAWALATSEGEGSRWVEETWGFAKLILPLLFVGVIVAGALLGRPGREGWIPSEWVEAAVGGNSIGANLFASVAGAFMYFATLTEIPIVQGLLGAGMGRGPALALLLAGPALSLPNMLVIRTVLGTKKTITFVSLVVLMATISGVLFGMIPLEVQL
jgi:hypothetical protein